jgi:hypothetical protein
MTVVVRLLSERGEAALAAISSSQGLVGTYPNGRCCAEIGVACATT